MPVTTGIQGQKRGTPRSPRPLTPPPSPTSLPPSTLTRMDSQQTDQPQTPRRPGAPLGNQNARTHGFYSTRLTQQERDAIPDPTKLKGLEGEIALIRLRIRRIVSNPDSPPELLFRAINTLVRTMELNEQLNNIRRR